MSVCLLMAGQTLAAQWSLAKFSLELFRPERRTQVKETAVLLWDDKAEQASLVLSADQVEPLFLVSVEVRSLPGFERELSRLKAQDSRAASLAGSLLEDFKGRKLQFIGRAKGQKRMVADFGFQIEHSRRFERYGRVWLRWMRQKEQIRLVPQKLEWNNSRAGLLWSLLKDKLVERIHQRIHSAIQKKGGK